MLGSRSVILLFLFAVVVVCLFAVVAAVFKSARTFSDNLRYFYSSCMLFLFVFSLPSSFSPSLCV